MPAARAMSGLGETLTFLAGAIEPQLPPFFQKDTESQIHRMAGVGRDLWGSSSPTSLPKQGHLEQAAQDLVQAGF